MQVAFLVVPDNNLSTRTFLRSFFNPCCDLIIRCAGGNQRPKVSVIDLRKVQPALIKRTIGMVIALPVNKDSAAFIDGPRRQHVSTQGSAWATREFFSMSQIACEQLQLLKILACDLLFFPFRHVQ